MSTSAVTVGDIPQVVRVSAKPLVAGSCQPRAPTARAVKVRVPLELVTVYCVDAESAAAMAAPMVLAEALAAMVTRVTAVAVGAVGVPLVVSWMARVAAEAS